MACAALDAPADTASIYLVNDANGQQSYKGWAEWRWNPGSGLRLTGARRTNAAARFPEGGRAVIDVG